MAKVKLQWISIAFEFFCCVMGFTESTDTSLFRVPTLCNMADTEDSFESRDHGDWTTVTGIETVQIHPMVTLFTHHFICPCTKATIVAGFGSGNQSFAPHGFIPPVRSQCLCDTTYSARSTRPLTNFQRV